MRRGEEGSDRVEIWAIASPLSLRLPDKLELSQRIGRGHLSSGSYIISAALRGVDTRYSCSNFMFMSKEAVKLVTT